MAKYVVYGALVVANMPTSESKLFTCLSVGHFVNETSNWHTEARALTLSSSPMQSLFCVDMHAGLWQVPTQSTRVLQLQGVCSEQVCHGLTLSDVLRTTKA